MWYEDLIDRIRGNKSKPSEHMQETSVADQFAEAAQEYGEKVTSAYDKIANGLMSKIAPFVQRGEDRYENAKEGVEGAIDKVTGVAQQFVGGIGALGVNLYGRVGAELLGPGVAGVATEALRGTTYLTDRFMAGIIDAGDNVWDYTLGGIYTLLGKDDKAREMFDNDPSAPFRNDAELLYKEYGGVPLAMEKAGNFAETLGASFPSITAGVASMVAAPYIGGSAAGVGIASSLFSSVLSGLNVAGRSTKAAYEETGELGKDEYAYGALRGAGEAAVNLATNYLVRGKLADHIDKSWAKASEEFLKWGAMRPISSIKDVVVTTVGQLAAPFVINAGSEALESGVETWLTPYFKRWTYDKTAQNATKGEIVWAAVADAFTSLVLYGFARRVAVDNVDVRRVREYTDSGKKTEEEGQVQEIIDEAKSVEGDYPAEQEVQKEVKELSESLAKTGGKVETDEQYEMIGKLKEHTAAAKTIPAIEASALSVIEQAEIVAEKYSQLGLRDESGKPIEITADGLTEGVVFDGTEEEILGSVRKALRSNKMLATVAAANVASGVSKAEEEVGAWERYSSGATEGQTSELSAMLGVDPRDYRAMKRGAKNFASTEQGKIRLREYSTLQSKAKSAPPNDKLAPTVIGTSLPDGVYRYGGENGICIIKEDGVIHLYDYARGLVSKPLTTQQVNAALARGRKQQ